MEIALLILAVSFFCFLFYMFNRVLRAINEIFFEFQNSLGELNAKLDIIDATLNRHYRSFGE
jgi:uncharacterized protein YoxC